MGGSLKEFVADLRKYVGATIVQGTPVFVVQGAPLHYEPCMYDVSVFQQVLDSGKAAKRILTVQGVGKPNSTIEIIAAIKPRVGEFVIMSRGPVEIAYVAECVVQLKGQPNSSIPLEVLEPSLDGRKNLWVIVQK